MRKPTYRTLNLRSDVHTFVAPFVPVMCDCGCETWWVSDAHGHKAYAKPIVTEFEAYAIAASMGADDAACHSPEV